MARLLAIVFGMTGLMTSRPLFHAWTIGEHPSAWARWTFTRAPEMSPSLSNSVKPFHTFVEREPDAAGTTI